MDIESPGIARAVRLAIESGNSVGEINTGWGRMRQVVYMSQPLTDVVKRAIAAELPNLRYFEFQDLHYPAETGFLCEENKVGVSFPVRAKDKGNTGR